jgi:acyl-CoA dehydrogenase
MDMLGAYGYTTKCEVEMGLRGVKSYSAGAEGGQNIMRIIIAREILGDEFVS